jgi:UDP-glucose 4-epimerase
MSTILVTGGLGFVGSNLVDMLCELGHNVYVIDDLSSESSSMDYMNKKAIYIFDKIQNIRNHFSTSQTKIRFDKVFHLAAEARIQPSFDRPTDYFNSNALGTSELMEYVRETKSGILVYATTSSKNHGSNYITPYTFYKVVGEGILKTYAKCFNIKCAMATFYNVYGPREPKVGEWATVVAKFGRQWVEGDHLTVVGDGSQSRDFTHVEDICKGLIVISNGDWKAENFDLGRGMPITILDVAKAYVDKDLHRIDFIPLRKNEGIHTESDWQTTENLIGWRATHNLLDYIIKNR